MSYLKVLTPSKSLLRTIWYLRGLIALAILVVAVLLFAYDLIFFNTFETFNNTTSYFPWAWNVVYTSFYSVQGMFVLAIVVIELLLASAVSILYYLVIPNLKKALNQSNGNKR